jgi:outer membrane protein assembly factor BamB
MIRTWLASLVLMALPASALAGDNVLTYHNSNQRDGAYVIPGLTALAAANMKRDNHFDGAISGHVYAQPLFWKPKGTKHGLVIVATESNTVYALNESNGKVVWQTPQLAQPMPLSQLPCGNIDPMGITGTPVIDPASARLYFNAMTKTGSGARHMLYALSLADGSVISGWPIDMQSQMTTKGASFDSSVHGERSALLFFKNKLYVNYGGHFGDCGDYRGTVAQIDTDTATVEAVWQTRATGGGIWAQGGAAGDDGNNIFVTTGNTFGAGTWKDGEAIIRLHPGLAHSDDTHDYFTPSNWKDLDNSDQDLGGTEAIPIDIRVPGKAKRVIAFGKDGKAYLANRNNLGGIGGQIQSLQVANGSIRTAPAVYETASSTMVAFSNSGNSHCGGNNIQMLNIAPSGGSPMSFAWCTAYGGNGAPIVTTTDGTADPLVWVPGAEGDNQLHAFNAMTGQVVFSGSGTSMSGLHHYQTILATKKRFYVAGDNRVYAFRWN